MTIVYPIMQINLTNEQITVLSQVCSMNLQQIQSQMAIAKTLAAILRELDKVHNAESKLNPQGLE